MHDRWSPYWYVLKPCTKTISLTKGVQEPSPCPLPNLLSSAVGPGTGSLFEKWPAPVGAVEDAFLRCLGDSWFSGERIRTGTRVDEPASGDFEEFRQVERHLECSQWKPLATQGHDTMVDRQKLELWPSKQHQEEHCDRCMNAMLDENPLSTRVKMVETVLTGRIATT